MFSKVSLSCILLCGLFSLSLAKTTKSAKSSPSPIKSETDPVSPASDQNVFLRLAKSVAFEALGELKQSMQRSSRQAELNMTMFPILPGNFSNLFDAFNFSKTGSPISGPAGIPVRLALSAFPIKSLLFGGITSIKKAIVEIILNILWFFFLLSGIAYFVCNLGLVSCSNLGGGLGGLGGGLGASGGSYGGGLGGSGGGGGDISSLWSSRAGIQEQYDRHTRPVYKALDEGYKKFR